MTDKERWSRVDALFRQAIDLEGPERAAFLNEVESSDPEIRRELDALLAIDAREIPLLDRPNWGGGEAAPPLGDERVGSYKLIRQVAEGGMGRVYLAIRDDGQYEREVAVKILKERLLTADTLHRFDRESKILARLENEGIARLYDAGVMSSGLPFLVMEYVQGERLDRYEWPRGATLKHKTKLFREVCRAVAHAHQHLVVHRDLKPSNILVTPQGRPKVIDFGIATTLENADGTAGDWTQGVSPMTPRYASPEQLDGAPVTTASDVFALGLIGTELLAGYHPAESGSEARRSELSPDLRSVLAKAMAESPDDRYPTAAHLESDISRWERGLPVEARPPSFAYTARRFLSRHRLGAAAVALLLAGATWSGVTLATLASNLAKERDRVAIEADVSRQVSDFLVELFDAAAPTGPESADRTAREVLEIGSERILDDETVGPESGPVHAAVLAAMGRAWYALSHFDRADEMLSRSLDAARSAEEPVLSQIAQTEVLLAEVEIRRANFDRAQQLATDALASDALTELPALRIRAHRALGRAQVDRGALDEAAPILERALAESEELFGPAHFETGEAHMSLARLAFERRDPPAAELHCERAVAAYTASVGESHPQTLAALGDLAIARHDQKKLVEAESTYRSLLRRQREIFGDRHTYVASTLNSLATTFYDRGEYGQAETLLEESVAVLRELSSEPNLDVATIATNLGRAYQESGKISKAIETYRYVLDIYEQRVEAGSPSLGAPLTFLGGALCSRGLTDEGLQHLHRALKIYRESLGAEHYRVGLALGTIGKCHAASGDRREALESLARARALIEGHFGADHRISKKIREAMQEFGAEPAAVPLDDSR